MVRHEESRDRRCGEGLNCPSSPWLSVPRVSKTRFTGDTIAAVATPPGQGGIGIVRISGSLAPAIGASLTGGELPVRRPVVRRFTCDGEPLDEGIVLYFPAPRSFTGEDVVELQGHGGPMVLQMVLEAVLAQGARLARPGEFTERAFVNGKLDLAQAEAVADLIGSASAAAARAAFRSLFGAFSREIDELDRQITELRVYVEASIDFPDEAVEFLASGQVARRIQGLSASVQQLLNQGRQGVLMGQGVNVALVGPPNAGKSSLLNRLTGEDTAIVTDIPGTTRDLLKVDLVLDNLPLRLVDTAGLRESGDPVEIEGVRRARREARQADIVLVLNDLAEPCANAPGDDWPRALVVDNKIDLVGAAPGIDRSQTPPRVRISCLTGAGIETLKEAVKEQVGFTGRESGFSARHRHLVALAQAAEALALAGSRLGEGAAAEIVAEELRQAHLALGEIRGQTAPDDLLGEIFSSFCIGK